MGFQLGFCLQVPALSEGLCLQPSQGPAPGSTLGSRVHLRVSQSHSHFPRPCFWQLRAHSSGAPKKGRVLLAWWMSSDGCDPLTQ